MKKRYDSGDQLCFSGFDSEIGIKTCAFRLPKQPNPEDWLEIFVRQDTSDPQDCMGRLQNPYAGHTHFSITETNIDCRTARELANRIIKWCDEIERTI